LSSDAVASEDALPESEDMADCGMEEEFNISKSTRPASASGEGAGGSRAEEEEVSSACKVCARSSAKSTAAEAKRMGR